MAIEFGVRFLGKIPIGSNVEVPAGAEIPGDINIDWVELVGGIASTRIWDYGLSAYCFTTEERLVKAIDEVTLEAEKGGRRVSFRGKEINHAKLSSPTKFPGFRFHYFYRDRD